VAVLVLPVEKQNDELGRKDVKGREDDKARSSGKLIEREDRGHGGPPLWGKLLQLVCQRIETLVRNNLGHIHHDNPSEAANNSQRAT
jgi:hypothetical protein